MVPCYMARMRGTTKCTGFGGSTTKISFTYDTFSNVMLCGSFGVVKVIFSLS